MVRLFPMGSFITSLCELEPTVCEVIEEAAGQYELYMEHPEDKYGKFKLLEEFCVIEAPVPRTVIPAIELPPVELLTVSSESDFWKKLPQYKNTGTNVNAQIKKIRENPAPYQWAQSRGFNAGAYCVYSGGIYKANEFTISDVPGISSKWSWQAALYPHTENPTYIAGEKYSTGISTGATVTKIADFNASYAEIRDPLGRIGYILKSALTLVTTESEVIPQQTITTQYFRIYHVYSDDDEHTIKVNAKHISYDFQGNRIMDCSFVDAEPINAIAMMQGQLMYEDDRRIACEFVSDEEDSYKLTKDWSFKNPINALLDNDEGIVPALDARLIRNNGDFYILKDVGIDTGITLRYGVNLRGVSWDKNVEEIVSRVIPRCMTEDDDYLYLEHGGTWTDELMTDWVENDEIYVESAVSDDFPYPIIEILDCNFKVGEKYTPHNSTEEVTRTVASCREEMLKEAQKRFTDDKCDGREISVTVEFVLLGDTEEYKQYKGLQQVKLYDFVTIKTKHFTIVARVSAYVYNCLTGRYNSIRVGSVSMFTKRVPGFRVVKESITYDKLSPGLIRQIKAMKAE